MGRFLQVLGSTFLVQLLYGSKHAPHIGTFPMPYVYVKAMLYSAGADELAPAERRYIQGLVELLLPASTPQGIENKLEIAQFIDAAPRAHSSKSESVSSFLSGSMLTSPVLSRILLYDSVRAATADGLYAQEERDHVALVSKQLGIPEAVRVRIEDISAKELELAQRKQLLLFATVPPQLAAPSSDAGR